MNTAQLASDLISTINECPTSISGTIKQVNGRQTDGGVLLTVVCDSREYLASWHDRHVNPHADALEALKKYCERHPCEIYVGGLVQDQSTTEQEFLVRPSGKLKVTGRELPHPYTM